METKTIPSTVTISPLAASKLKDMMSKVQDLGDKGLRIFVKAGGCKGFSYGMGFDAFRDGDDVSQAEGIKVLVDANSLQYLQGAVVDFKDAMMGGGFTISNPNATQGCGCGQSFKAKSGERGNPQSCGSSASDEHGHSHGGGGGCGSGGGGCGSSSAASEEKSGGGCGSGGCC